jgi:hypothetical protein
MAAAATWLMAAGVAGATTASAGADSPQAAMVAARAALARGDYTAYVDAFDAQGQRRLVMQLYGVEAFAIALADLKPAQAARGQLAEAIGDSVRDVVVRGGRRAIDTAAGSATRSAGAQAGAAAAGVARRAGSAAAARAGGGSLQGEVVGQAVAGVVRARTDAAAEAAIARAGDAVARRGEAEMEHAGEAAGRRAQMAVAGPQAPPQPSVLGQRFNALLARYGMPAVPFGRAATDDDGGAFGESLMVALQHADHRALGADLIRFAGQLPGGNVTSFAQSLPFARGVLTDLRIDGDRARGTLSDKPARFVRREDGWYLVSNDDGDDDSSDEAGATDAQSDEGGNDVDD